MPANPPNPAWPVYVALGISLLGNIVAVVGWFVVHHLTKKRESERDMRAKDDAAEARDKAASDARRVTKTEASILKQCITSSGFERGHVWIMRVDAFGAWVRAGTHDFFDQSDNSFQAEYLDGFESLLNRGFFRQESGDFYVLTSFGFQRAKEENEQGAAGNRP